MEMNQNMLMMTPREEEDQQRERARERERRKERDTRVRKPRTRSRSGSGRRRSKSRGRSRSRSGSLSEALRTQVERLSEKVKYMESRKRWSSVANEKQYLYNVKIKQLAIEDVRKQLEDYFGSRKDVPEKIEEAIKIGEKEIDARIKMIKIADQHNWYTVNKYIADPLCENEEDDKKLKAAIREAKEELAKKKSSGYGYGNRSRGRDGYRSGGRSYRRDSRDRDRRSDRYVEVAKSELKEVCAGEKRGPVTRVERRATSGKTAEHQERKKTKEGSKKEAVKDFITSRTEVANKDFEEKVVFDRSEDRLDELEGKLEEEEEVCLMFEEDY